MNIPKTAPGLYERLMSEARATLETGGSYSPSSPVWTGRVNIVQVANDQSVELRTSDPEAL
ncbi:hypothetical protein N7489_007800 [Penicillium chrysogenum]|uniref:Uncharacterized protein n=1 Tax=Penicillium chrysogenum TaxID=5076 RepID=A0ABQ8WB24_PENCH|nr:uncharacterized protein N7489_007800 [Penicillium chrysogenum]KAJ5237709.1 hypothetical protein N7489_007800 [Penicillium chrysogenum]KAJ5262026.1 hypothetical protein N7505_008893 [Penicillium chrysogenum]KAJ5278009.1 hypothetical protein N7524_004162 [Penicillium chrysogenum]KAJ6159955.1 hypothetical protein N7497_004492 [Penicillium chrysogenum]